MAMTTRTLMLGVAMCAWMLCEATAVGQGGGGMGGGMGGGRGGGGHGGGRDSGQSNLGRNLSPPPPQVILTPHGGQYLETETNRYEIVYMPLQTRIYLFDKEMKPLSARDIHAQMSPKLSSASAPPQIPFQYVAMPAGAVEQDYVVAAFDISQLSRETPIAFEFSGLPSRHKFLGIWDRHDGTASFTPLFSPAKIRPYVARVLPTEADRDGVMRQKFCPVSNQMLGSKGPVIKVYIADNPLYLSGEDCLAAVQQAPDKYLPHGK
jgi:hypothetical protein